MTYRLRFLLTTILFAAIAAPAATVAETVFTDGVDISDNSSNSADLYVEDDVVLEKRLCVGSDCNGDGHGFPSGATVQIAASVPWIRFSSDVREWTLSGNDKVLSNLDRFSVWDHTASSIPFSIEGGAPTDAFWIGAGTGNIGLGTGLPEKELHIVDGSAPTLRLEQDTSNGHPAQTWDLYSTAGGFTIYDRTNSKVSFYIQAAAPIYSFVLKPNGDLGLGTFSTDGKLHTKGNGTQLVLFESGDGGAVQVRFKTDSENRRFLAVDNNDLVKSQIIFGDNDIRFTGQTDSGANLWMTVSAAGLVTQGPTCNPGPCDAVFDPEVFTPLPIEDHAAAMWANKFLGAIGPTGPDQPVNLTEKMGGVIHELEVAHIYIEKLHARLAAQEIQNSQLAERLAAQNEWNARLLARIEALEATSQ